MKNIKIKYCDGMSIDNDLVFLPILEKHYKLSFSEDPEYVFYGPFGKDHLKYDCIRIFTTGECVTPNFNECDYATGFDYLNLGDRYLRLPLSHIMFRNRVNMMDIALKRDADKIISDDRDFCSFVVSNRNGMCERREFFELLSKYKSIDSGGKFLNNVGGPIENKLDFDKKHKFSICFENECYPGYTTEKLTEAFAAGCIPIYLGDPEVGRIFNKKAFVDCRDFDSFADAVAFVKKIDENDELYQRMLKEPVLSDNTDYGRQLDNFLCNIINQDITQARRRPYAPRAHQIEQSFRISDYIYYQSKRIKNKIKGKKPMW